jgi:hypothetical protein
MKAGKIIAGFSSILLALPSAQAQGTFQNLNFEAANVPASGPEPYGTFVPIGSALPGWTAYVGVDQQTQAGYNTVTDGTANISLIGPTWTTYDTDQLGFGLVGIIDGNYSVLLESGVSPTNTGLLETVSIAQNGTIPSTSQSLEYEATVGGSLSVSFAGNVLSPIALSSGLGEDGQPFTEYGVNISAWAGQTGELEFTANANMTESTIVLDDIMFSPSDVPEPTTLALLCVGGAILASRRWLPRGT